MASGPLRYDKMVETALRGVVREALVQVAKRGLPGAHHFYITFSTGADGVEVPDYLRQSYPQEMTIVLEHQFWDLDVEPEKFSVTLSFSNRPERLSVPFNAVTAFADPSVKFGLQFAGDSVTDAPAPAAPVPLAVEKPAPAGEDAEDGDPKPTGGGEVVSLERFRKK